MDSDSISLELIFVFNNEIEFNENIAFKIISNSILFNYGIHYSSQIDIKKVYFIDNTYCIQILKKYKFSQLDSLKKFTQALF